MSEEPANPTPANPAATPGAGTQPAATQSGPNDAVEVRPLEVVRKIAVVGEIPFAGCAMVKALQSTGFTARVLCSDDQTAARVTALQVNDGTGTAVEVVRGSLASADDVNKTFQGVYGAIFLSPVNFNGRIHRPDDHLDDVRRVLAAAQQHAIRKIIYHSALGAAPNSNSRALRDAALAEELVHGARIEDFRIRTGPLMGPGDGFLSDIMKHARVSNPIMGIMGYGSTTVQPLHVDDLALCVTRIFVDQRDEFGPGVYALAGPETTTLLDLFDLAAKRAQRGKLKFHAPLFVLKLLTAVVPNPALAERVNLLFDVFYTEQNDAGKLLAPGQRLASIQQTQDEILRTLPAR